MSHFTVLVVGDDVERQLQPFHEFECTGTNDEFVIDVDITADVLRTLAEPDYEGNARTLAAAVEYHIGENKIVDDESKVDRAGLHKHGFALVHGGSLVRAVDRTNPNAKWDWWVIGGRWTGYFTTKNRTGSLGKCPSAWNDEEVRYFAERRSGNKADSCRWGDVDIDAMKSDARAKAEAEFSRWESVFTEHGRPRSWEAVRGSHPGNIEAARTEYHAQAAIKAMRKLDVWDEPDRYGFERAAYVERETRKSITPFAILNDGVWHEQGSMGWFACVSDEKSDWLDQAEALLASIHPNTVVTIVDCHI